MTKDIAMPAWVRNLRQQAEASTPGPWYVRRTDDPSFMSAYYVTSERGRGSLDVAEWDHPTTVVAITLLQDPNLALTPQYYENVEFIAGAREGVPRLIDALDRALTDRSMLMVAMRELLATAGTPEGAIEHDEARKRAQRLLIDLDRG
jgi:hypothetical protein